MRVRVRPPALLALVVAAGCAGETTASGEPFSVSDSSGVTISTNSRAAISAAPEIALVEELRLGSVAGREEELFGNVFDVAVDVTGTIYVLDISARTVRVFDAAGSPVRTIGQSGEGPGEFAWEPLSLTVSDDTVAVLDRFRLHLFDTDGDFLHSTQQSFAGNEPTQLWAKAGGAWLVGRLDRRSPSAGESRVTTDAFHVSAVDLEEGEATGLVVAVSGGPRWYVDDGGRSFTQFLGPDPTAAAGGSGRIYATSGSSHEIYVFSSDGDLLGVHRSDPEPVPLSTSEADRLVSQMVAYYDSVGISSMADGYQRAYDALRAPTIRPTLGRLFVAADGSILVERVDLDPNPLPIARDDPSAWDVIDPGGRILGRLALDPGTRVEQVTASHLYVVERDELGVQYVVRYRMDRP
jgi:hypothetical protein